MRVSDLALLRCDFIKKLHYLTYRHEIVIYGVACYSMYCHQVRANGIWNRQHMTKGHRKSLHTNYVPRLYQKTS